MNRLAILDICCAEMGVSEIMGNEHNSRILEYHQITKLKATIDETPWCAAFVNWVLKQAGYAGTNSAAARSFLNWGKEIEQPTMGCILVLRRGKSAWQGHVGFFVGFDRHGHVLCLGGNQSNRVCVSAYKASDILVFRN